MLEFEPGDVILAEDAINTADDLQRMLNSNYDVLANLLNGRQQCIAELLTDNMARPYSSLDYTAVWNRETNFLHPYHRRALHRLLLRHLPGQCGGGQL